MSNTVVGLVDPPYLLYYILIPYSHFFILMAIYLYPENAQKCHNMASLTDQKISSKSILSVLEVGRNNLAIRVVTMWNKFPAEAVESHTDRSSEIQLDKHLSKML